MPGKFNYIMYGLIWKGNKKTALLASVCQIFIEIEQAEACANSVKAALHQNFLSMRHLQRNAAVATHCIKFHF